MINVFDETILGGIKLKNRILRSATYEGLSDDDSRPTDMLTDMYVRLARGGAGAIITGFVGTDRAGRAMGNMCLLDRDDRIDDFKAMTARVREQGTPIILQIAHCGGQSNPKITGETAAAPSGLFYTATQKRARQLDENEIAGIIDGFIQAIARAKKAGFDGVQIHAAHGYLLSEFLSPAQNTRTDGWGGSTKKRFRIVAEIVEGARRLVGDFPIWVKMSGHDGEKNGMRINEALTIAKLFEEVGVDAIEVSCGSGNDGFYTMRMAGDPVPAMAAMMPVIRDMKPIKKIVFRIFSSLLIKKYTPILNYNVDAAEMIKKHVSVPVIVVGGIRSLAVIESIIRENKADCVSLSRPFIIEPNIVQKFAEGRQTESRCCNCGYCLMACMENPLKCFNGKLPK